LPLLHRISSPCERHKVTRKSQHLGRAGSRGGQGSALPGPWADAGAEHALNGASAGLPQKARRAAPSASSVHRKGVRPLLQYLDTRVDRPLCNPLTFYAVPHCVYYGLQTQATPLWPRTPRSLAPPLPAGAPWGPGPGHRQPRPTQSQRRPSPSRGEAWLLVTPGVPPPCLGRREDTAGHSQAVQTDGVPAEAAVTGE